MTTHNENHENPGIFVRIFDQGRYEVCWLNGHDVIELAQSEAEETGEAITDYLQEKEVDSYVREIYSPWGQYEGVAVLRRLTLYESVHYLGRHAKVCAFLRPKAQAVRFIEGLEKNEPQNGFNIAQKMRALLFHFDETQEQRLTQAAMCRLLEEQLLNMSLSSCSE